MSTAERIYVEALELPEDERIALAERLLSLPVSSEVEGAWFEEASRRLARYKSGAEPGMTPEEVMRFMVSKRT